MISMRKILGSRIFSLNLQPSTSTTLVPIIGDRLSRDGSIDRRLQLNGICNYVTGPRDQLTADQIAQSKQVELPSTSANSKSIPLCNHTGDKSIHRRLQLDRFRNYGTALSRLLIGDQKVQSKQADSREERVRHNRRLATKHFMAWTILRLSDLLMDMDCLLENDVTRLWKEEENTCYEFWLAVFEHSKTPLAIKLKKEVLNSGIPYKQFCRSIVEIYFLVYRYRFIGPHDKNVTPDDVLDTIDDLEFNRAEYECLQILFSLKEIYNKKIEDKKSPLKPFSSYN